MGEMGTELLYGSKPAAVKVRVKPAVTVTGLGATVMVASCPAVSVTFAVPVILLPTTINWPLPATVPAFHVLNAWPASSVGLKGVTLPRAVGER